MGITPTVCGHITLGISLNEIQIFFCLEEDQIKTEGRVMSSFNKAACLWDYPQVKTTFKAEEGLKDTDSKHSRVTNTLGFQI